MAETCGVKYIYNENVTFTCNLMKGHAGFHSDSMVYMDKRWNSFRWGNANDMVIPERDD